MHYFCALNTLQYKKKIAVLEPLLGYMQAQVISHSVSCRSERRCKSSSRELIYWNSLQDLFLESREAKPISIPVAVILVAKCPSTIHFLFKVP